MPTRTVQHGITTVDLALRTRRRRGYVASHEIVYDTATIIAFDPGGTTGWSLISVAPQALSDRNEKILANVYDHQHGQVDCGVRRGNLDSTLHGGISTDGEFSGVYDCALLVREWPSAAVVIEDFVLNTMRRDRDLLSPVRIASALEYNIWLQGRDVFYQGVGDAKAVVSDKVLRDIQMYDPVDGMQHARDADRHAILFLRKAKSNAEFRERAWPHLYGQDGPFRKM